MIDFDILAFSAVKDVIFPSLTNLSKFGISV